MLTLLSVSYLFAAIFIDIVTPKTGSEEYRLVEVVFGKDCFDRVETKKAFSYLLLEWA